MNNGHQPPPYAPPAGYPQPGAPQAPAPQYHQQAPQAPQYQQAPAPGQYGPPPGYPQQQPPPQYQQAPAPPAPQYGPPPGQAPYTQGGYAPGQAPAAPPPWQGQAAPRPQAPAPQGGSRFGGMRNAEAYGSGNYFDVSKGQEGEYDCSIKAVTWNPQGRKGALVILEFVVQRSTSPQVPVGTIKSVTYNTTTNPEIAWPQLLCFLGACLGLDPSNKDHLQVINTNVRDDAERLMEQACDHHAFDGKVIHISVMPHTTRDKRVVSRTKFAPVQGAPAPGQAPPPAAPPQGAPQYGPPPGWPQQGQ
jgi:hypothetical protein